VFSEIVSWEKDHPISPSPFSYKKIHFCTLIPPGRNFYSLECLS
jgi:hypothetical protein